MSDTLTLKVYPDADAIAEGTPVEYNDVDYVSLVNHGTFGPPALVAPKPSKGGTSEPPVARKGECVIYVNTSLIPLFSIKRNED